MKKFYVFFLTLKSLHAMNFPTEEQNRLPFSAMNLLKETVEEILVTEAKKVHPKAQFDLANFYKKEKKIEDAILWYTKAAEQGDAIAQNSLAFLYRKLGNINETISWYKKAAEQGKLELTKFVFQLYKKKYLNGIDLLIELKKGSFYTQESENKTSLQQVFSFYKKYKNIKADCPLTYKDLKNALVLILTNEQSFSVNEQITLLASDDSKTDLLGANLQLSNNFHQVFQYFNLPLMFSMPFQPGHSFVDKKDIPEEFKTEHFEIASFVFPSKRNEEKEISEHVFYLIRKK